MIQEKERLGYRTIADLARAIGAKPNTVFQRIYTLEQMQAPTHTIGNGRRLYYTSKEFNALVKMYRDK